MAAAVWDFTENAKRGSSRTGGGGGGVYGEFGGAEGGGGARPLLQKNPRAHKNKIGTPPSPNPKYPPPPKRRNFVG